MGGVSLGRPQLSWWCYLGSHLESRTLPGYESVIHREYNGRNIPTSGMTIHGKRPHDRGEKCRSPHAPPKMQIGSFRRPGHEHCSAAIGAEMNSVCTAGSDDRIKV